MRTILKYTIPTILALLMSGLYTIIDGLFIGQHSGDVGLAAINIAWPLPALLIATGLGIGVGGSILYSQKVGKNEFKSAFYTLKITLATLVIVSLGFMVVFYFNYPQILRLLGAQGAVYTEAHAYMQIVIMGCLFQIFATGAIPLLRNLNFPIHAMFISMSGVILNLILNYYYIVLQDMGIAGAALATLLAQMSVSLLTLALFALNYRKLAQMQHQSDEDVHWKTLFREMLERSLAPFGISLTPSLVLIFSNYACLYYGSTEGVASYTVLSYITFPASSMLLGVGDGLQPLMSLRYAQKDQMELKKIIRIGYRIGLSLAIAIMVGLFLFSDALAITFGLSSTAKIYFDEAIRICLFAFPFIFLLKFQVSIKNATGQSLTATKFTYIEGLLIAPLFIFGLSALFSLSGVWLSYLATSIVMCGIAYTKIIK